MGSIVGKEQMQILEEKVNLLKAETELIYDGKHDLVEANYENGAFFTPKVFYNDKPFEKNISHELEAFGPVSTIMTYKDAEEAAALAKRGKGSLVGSIVSHDEKFVAETSWKMNDNKISAYQLSFALLAIPAAIALILLLLARKNYPDPQEFEAPEEALPKNGLNSAY